MNIIRIMNTNKEDELIGESIFFHEPAYGFLPENYHMHYLWLLSQDIYHIFYIFQDDTAQIGQLQQEKKHNKLLSDEDSIASALYTQKYYHAFQQLQNNLDHSVHEWKEYFHTLQQSLMDSCIYIAPVLPYISPPSSSGSHSTAIASSIPPLPHRLSLSFASFTSIPLYYRAYHHYLHHHLPTTRLWLLEQLEQWRMISKVRVSKHFKSMMDQNQQHQEHIGRLFWLQSPKGTGKSTVLAAYIKQLLSVDSNAEEDYTLPLYCFLSSSNKTIINDYNILYKDILLSLSLQLLHYFPSLYSTVLPIFHQCPRTTSHVSSSVDERDSLKGRIHREIEELMELFYNTWMECRKLIPISNLLIVIDGVDDSHFSTKQQYYLFYYYICCKLSSYIPVIISSSKSKTHMFAVLASKGNEDSFPVHTSKTAAKTVVQGVKKNPAVINQQQNQQLIGLLSTLEPTLRSIIPDVTVMNLGLIPTTTDTINNMGEHLKEDLNAYITLFFAKHFALLATHGHSLKRLKSSNISATHISLFQQTLTALCLQKYYNEWDIITFFFHTMDIYLKSIIILYNAQSELQFISLNQDDKKRRICNYYKKELLRVLPPYSNTSNDVYHMVYVLGVKQLKKTFRPEEWDVLWQILGIVAYSYVPLTIQDIFLLLQSATHVTDGASSATVKSPAKSAVSPAKLRSVSPAKSITPMKPMNYTLNRGTPDMSIGSSSTITSRSNITPTPSNKSGIISKIGFKADSRQGCSTRSRIRKLDLGSLCKLITLDLSSLLYVSLKDNSIEFQSPRFRNWLQSQHINKEFFIQPERIHEDYFIQAALPLIRSLSSTHTTITSAEILTSPCTTPQTVKTFSFFPIQSSNSQQHVCNKDLITPESQDNKHGAGSQYDPILNNYLLNCVVYHLSAIKDFQDAFLVMFSLPWNMCKLSYRSILDILYDIDFVNNMITTLPKINAQTSKVTVDYAEKFQAHLSQLEYLYLFYSTALREKKLCSLYSCNNDTKNCMDTKLVSKQLCYQFCHLYVDYCANNNWSVEDYVDFTTVMSSISTDSSVGSMTVVEMMKDSPSIVCHPNLSFIFKLYFECKNWLAQNDCATGRLNFNILNVNSFHS